MPPSNGVDYEAEKRRLRLAIARSRRRIDREIHRGFGAARRLTRWKTYVRRYPAAALGAGASLGWILSAALRPGVLTGLLASRMTRRVADRIADLLWGEVKGLWEESSPDRVPRSEGDGDG